MSNYYKIAKDSFPPCLQMFQGFQFNQKADSKQASHVSLEYFLLLY